MVQRDAHKLGKGYSAPVEYARPDLLLSPGRHAVASGQSKKGGTARARPSLKPCLRLAACLFGLPRLGAAAVPSRRWVWRFLNSSPLAAPGADTLAHRPVGAVDHPRMTALRLGVLTICQWSAPSYCRSRTEASTGLINALLSVRMGHPRVRCTAAWASGCPSSRTAQ